MAAFHQMATAAGLVCLTQPRAESFGQLAVYADPDGLGITVIQPLGKP
jgi:hypothetical protein